MLDATQQLRFRRPRPSDVTTAWLPGVSLIWHADEGLYYENPRNRFCYFRKTFELAAPVEFSELRIIADTKYLSYVNGTEIGRGPSRFDPRWAYYDVYDVSPHLVDARIVLPNGETHRLEPGRARWRVAREGKGRAETGLEG